MLLNGTCKNGEKQKKQVIIWNISSRVEDNGFRSWHMVVLFGCGCLPSEQRNRSRRVAHDRYAVAWSKADTPLVRDKEYTAAIVSSVLVSSAMLSSLCLVRHTDRRRGSVVVPRACRCHDGALVRGGITTVLDPVGRTCGSCRAVRAPRPMERKGQVEKNAQQACPGAVPSFSSLGPGSGSASSDPAASVNAPARGQPHPPRWWHPHCGDLAVRTRVECVASA